MGDASRFGLFLMLFNTSYKLILCLMRRLGCLNDKVNAPIAGFMSALTMAVDAGSRRELISVLMMSRAIETCFNIGESNGTIPKTQYRDWILWISANLFLQSAMGMNQQILNNSIRKFFQTWSQMKENDRILVNVWSKMLADGVPSF